MKRKFDHSRARVLKFWIFSYSYIPWAKQTKSERYAVVAVLAVLLIGTGVILVEYRRSRLSWLIWPAYLLFIVFLAALAVWILFHRGR